MQYFIKQTETYLNWYIGMKDSLAKAAIARRMDRAASGNLGDVKSVGNGISEMRIDVGAGYRVYFTVRERVMVFLLLGGDKSSQAADIRRAAAFAKEIKNG